MRVDLLSVVPDSYPASFVNALGRLFADEGGYADDPDDSGGETKYGISKRRYPELDIAKLTRAGAAEIYYRDWWLKFHFDDLPEAIGAKLFNLSVNTGPRAAIIFLQRALRACSSRVNEDGRLGPQTAAAARTANSMALLAALRSEAAGYYRMLAASGPGKRGDFLDGWLNRAYE